MSLSPCLAPLQALVPSLMLILPDSGLSVRWKKGRLVRNSVLLCTVVVPSSVFWTVRTYFIVWVA